MEQYQIEKLLDKYKKGIASEQEITLLLSVVQQWAENPDVKIDEQEFRLVEAELLVRLMPEVPVVRTVKLWKRISVAASIILCLGLGFYFYTLKSANKIELASVQLNDIEPAGNKAYLTLANGKRIALDDATNGNLATQSNVQVAKTADGQLVYTITENGSKTNTLEYNTIETPNGGKYEIMLPDGTHVWINAGSKLKYPVSFASLKERKVELQGEAYFEVAHNRAIPFRVSSNGQTVEVLGTHFNINSYSNENVVKTTLLEGSVKVSAHNSQDFKLLKPGEQASLQNDRIQVSKADMEQAVGWKNGDFVFAGEDLKTVMREVSRWYNVDVEYKGNVNVNGIFSAFPRTMKLSQLLKALEANQGIHFKIEGRRILVMP